MPRLSKIEFTYLPQFGEYKTINGERYLNPWINYSIPKPVLVGKVSNLLCMVFKPSNGDVNIMWREGNSNTFGGN